MATDKLHLLRTGAPLSRRDLLLLTVQLSIPAILGEMSTVVMEFIDAAMLGHLGAGEAAAVGLVANTVWVMGWLCVSVCTGFTVQVAQSVGAQDEAAARQVAGQGIVTALGLSLLLMLAGTLGAQALPRWLGGDVSIRADAASYVRICALFAPAMILRYLSGGMIQCSGNMRLPGVVQTLVCLLDVVFNTLLIFPTRTVAPLGAAVTIPGAGLGVRGAALGTGLAEVTGAVWMLGWLLLRSPTLRLRRGERLRWSRKTLRHSASIGLPLGLEQIVMGAAQIATTRIVSPLGVFAVAAHSFAISIESLCYMPGFGIGAAATTLIGQSIGAKRHDVTRTLAWLTTAAGMAVMGAMGALMYRFAPDWMALMSPDAEIQRLGGAVLRMEAFAEPMFAAAIVASRVLRGAGDTLTPTLMNFATLWLVRLPLAAMLAGRMGLRGVWLAMCAELWVRGAVFLLRIGRKNWDQETEDHD